MDPLLRDQVDISSPVPMPVDSMDASSTVTVVTGETVVWYYSNASVWTAAATQAAGTIVTAKLKYNRLLNSINATIGGINDTSFSFGANTRFNALVGVPETVFTELQFLDPADQVARISGWLPTQGQYCIDHRRGQVWGNPRATVANDSGSYDIMGAVQGSSGPSANVSVPPVASPATLTNVNSSASSVMLLASNASRANAIFFNDSTQVLYLKEGTTASATSYSVQIQPGGYFELPLGVGGKVYQGEIDGIWAAANGAVRITELT